MKTYKGERVDGACVVHVEPAEAPLRWRTLPPRHDLANHSPDGFEWGYGGSGPAQLALALLADALADDARAIRLYQRFKSLVVAKLQHAAPWSITSAAISILADELEPQQGEAA